MFALSSQAEACGYEGNGIKLARVENIFHAVRIEGIVVRALAR